VTYPLVASFSAKNFQIVKVQHELDDDQNSGDDQLGVVSVVSEDEPDHQDGSNQEEDSSDQRGDLLELVAGESQEVQDEQNDVDDHEHEVETRGEPSATFMEAGRSAEPVTASAQDPRDDESDDDLSDLDDTTVGRQVSSIDVSHFVWRAG